MLQLDSLRDEWLRLVSRIRGGDAEARRQSALLRLSEELAVALDETEVCQRVVDGLHGTLGYDFVAVFLVSKYICTMLPV